jgi:hypothetical protein
MNNNLNPINLQGDFEIEQPAVAASTSDEGTPIASTEVGEVGEGAGDANPQGGIDAVSAEGNSGRPSFSEPQWSKDAPRGGRAVLSRMLKESTAVPLFLAQTFVQSLRDVGYDSTTSALCEHVDNGIGAGATEIRVFFRQTGKQPNQKFDILVLDNGHGMAPQVLKTATAFGGSMRFDNREGIGRFGMGGKTAGLSMAPAMEIISWIEKGAFYRMTLDTEAIGRDRSNVIQLDEPAYLETLPSDVATFFTTPMMVPRNALEQDIVAPRGVDVEEAMGTSGTIVHMPNCDRLSSRTSKTLVEDATKTFAHVYRRYIDKGLKLYVNNRVVEASDPTLSMHTARHTKIDALANTSVKTSNLVAAKRASIFPNSGASVAYDVHIRVYALPIRDWSKLSRKALNDIGVFNEQIVSILRNDREVFAGSMPKIVRRHSTTAWLRVEIEFPGELDEAFGVAANKQGVRLKDFVVEAIRKGIAQDLQTVISDIESVQAQNTVERQGSGPSASERKAAEADPFQADRLDSNLSPEQQEQMEQNLRGLAVGLRRESESLDDAFERVKASPYLIAYKPDRFWPAFVTENHFGRVILTINTAHPFYTRFYEPLLKLCQDAAANGIELSENEADSATAMSRQKASELVTVLELTLLSMARAQAIMGHDDQEVADLLDNFRKSWSDSLKTQINRL